MQDTAMSGLNGSTITIEAGAVRYLDFTAITGRGSPKVGDKSAWSYCRNIDAASPLDNLVRASENGAFRALKLSSRWPIAKLTARWVTGGSLSQQMLKPGEK